MGHTLPCTRALQGLVWPPSLLGNDISVLLAAFQFQHSFFSSLKKVKDRSEARRGQSRDKPMASDTLFCSGLLERLVWKWDMLKCPI